ncbi:MAG: type V CRISPR-associated protein Cas12a/Cpf1 [Victivallaceae bacterium]|jgi:CRISPR-associated protein Cpf1
MADNGRSLANFTNQYQLSKTLRFELKPVGQTAEWIKKHNIIDVDGDKLTGEDADRAVNYKYAKLLLDELHRQFIEDALKLAPEAEFTKKLKDKIIELYSASEIKDADLPGNIFKQILNNKADEWIKLYQQEMPQYWQKEFDAKIANETSEKKIKYLRNSFDKLNKRCQEQPFKNSGVDVLYGSNEDPIKLLEWAVRKEKVRPTFGDIKHEGNPEAIMPKERIIEYIIRGFDNFCTYFAGFNENRANVYDVTGAKSTSLVHRIFMQNMQFHFNNIRKWEKIKASLEKYAKDLSEKNYNCHARLAECERELNFSANEIFSPEAFINFINQSGIDRYNEILGGLAQEGGKTKPRGINEFINLVRQQTGAKRNEFPPLQLFYKQILSKSDRTFISAFETDEEMFDRIKDFRQKCFIESEAGKLPVIQEFIKDITRLIAESLDEKTNIFISKDKLTRISQELTGSYNTINLRMLSELGEKAFNQNGSFSIQQIDNALNAVVDGKKFSSQDQNIKAEYQSNSGNILFDFFSKRLDALFVSIEASWKILHESRVLTGKILDKNRENEGDKGFEQVAAIKGFLDNSIEILGFAKDWMLQEKKLSENINTVWYETLQLFCDQFPIIKLYNMVRNYVTQKAYSDKKLKLNFDNSTLLDGWDRNKESSNYGVLLEKDGLYFLGIMTPESNNIFDYEIADADSLNKKQEKQELANAIKSSGGEKLYRKVIYKQIADVSKDIFTLCWDENNNKAIRKTKGREAIWGENITRIKEAKSYQNNEADKKHYFGYLIKCANSYWKHFNIKLKPADEYEDFSSLIKDIDIQGYKINFDNIKKSYIDEKVAKGELYLFQIYSKDFSQEKKGGGNDNLHTSYFKLLFDEENLKDTVLKLNGQAEIFFRKASVELTEEKKAKGHHYEELKDKFNYPIIKDRRFAEDKFFFHCPISLNFKAEKSIPQDKYKPSFNSNFNLQIKTFLQNNPEVNIIGIDRGEKHLLYYSVINRNGNVIEQGSLNTIAGFKGREIDYHANLDKKEANRDKARKSWSAIESIKELKAGYLSQVVHKLAQLIVEHNAIVVLEDLNYGFKRGRFKVEKQVYQKFEKALIDKLNYMVFKDKEHRLVSGHYLNAYQLSGSYHLDSLKSQKQSGILFYTAASYTSTTDPVTGFLKNVNVTYENVEESLKLWESFDSIIYNPIKDRFEFIYTLGKIAGKSTDKEKDEEEISKKQWTVYSCVDRSRYIKPESTEEQKQASDRNSIGKLGKHEIFCVTNEMKKLFENANINYKEDKDIKKVLLEQNNASLHRSCLYFFNAIMAMRVTDSSKKSGTDENDFILSPVEPFFDSRKKYTKLPENGDANGAYNIARKGICMLNKIDAAENLPKINLLITKRDWQEYAQSDAVVKAQTAKLNK